MVVLKLSRRYVLIGPSLIVCVLTVDENIGLGIRPSGSVVLRISLVQVGPFAKRIALRVVFLTKQRGINLFFHSRDLLKPVVTGFHIPPPPPPVHALIYVA